MSVHTDDVIISNTPLPIDGNNPNPVTVGGSVSVSGSVSVGNFPATQPISGTVTGNQGSPNTPANSWPVEVTDGTNVLGTSAHPLQTISAVASTSTVIQITSTGSNQVLLASNANRKKAILYFTSGIWSIKLGAGASSTSFTYQSNTANTTIEVTNWNGEIDAICTTSGKLVNVTELS